MLDYFRTFYIGMAYGPSYIVTEILFAVTAVILLTKFEKTRRFVITLCVGIVCMWVYEVLLNSLIYWLTSSSTLTLFITMPLGLLIYALAVSRYSIRCRIVMAFIFMLDFIATMTISANAAQALDVYFTAANTPFAVTFYIVLMALVVFVSKFWNLDRFDFVPNMCIVVAVVVSVAGLVLEGIAYFSSFEIDANFHLAVSLGFYIVTIILYYLLYRMCHEVKEDKLIALMKMYRAEEKRNFEAEQTNAEDLRKLRHDLRNEYGYLSLLINTQQYDKANEYLASMGKSVMPVLTAVHSGNSTIDTIMSMEKRKATDKGVDLDIRCAVPETIPVDKFDLISLISNLADNAMEYMERKQVGGSVRIEVYQKDSYLFVIVINPLADDEDREKVLKLKTTKLDPSQHGYGTRIVSEIAHKYNGSCVFDIKNGKFAARAMLSIEVKEPAGKPAKA